ncbi:MAG: MBL fold metallo-hydrolase [Planctomycetota bacterium]|nr:MBL fold metallo-hydrolase [Planctomycetota bacterium]
MPLEITTIVVGAFQQNCRVVKDVASGDGVVIDPGAEPERILEAVEASGARITHLLATHAHLDHVGAVAAVRRALNVPFALHGADLPLLRQLPVHGAMFGQPGLEIPTVDLDLADIDEIPLGAGHIRVVHTPGHTPGGVTFLWGREGFFGDSLFRMSVGRTDLGGDAEVYARTLRDVILELPDDTIVYTGHGPDTTIGAERRQNPFLNGTLDLD